MEQTRYFLSVRLKRNYSTSRERTEQRVHINTMQICIVCVWSLSECWIELGNCLSDPARKKPSMSLCPVRASRPPKKESLAFETGSGSCAVRAIPRCPWHVGQTLGKGHRPASTTLLHEIDTNLSSLLTLFFALRSAYTLLMNHFLIDRKSWMNAFLFVYSFSLDQQFVALKI